MLVFGRCAPRPIQVDVVLDVRLSCEAGSSSVMAIAGRKLVSEFMYSFLSLGRLIASKANSSFGGKKLEVLSGFMSNQLSCRHEESLGCYFIFGYVIAAPLND